MNSEFEKEGAPACRDLLLTPLAGASGGTANLYTARLFGKKVFVKEIKPEFADDPRMLAAFRKEAEIGFRLDHRNLPKYIYAEGVLAPERYIVQEFIDGYTLPDFIRETPAYFRDRKNVKRFIREFADVIDYLHRNQVVHLDLKPENILISRVGNALKLVDLGFCASDFYDDTRGFTSSGLAPEGVDKPRERGSVSDYFGLGKILTYIRTNTPGFPKGRFSKLERKLLLPDPAKRLASKEEIENLLDRGVGKKGVWLATGVILIALVPLIFFSRGNTGKEQGTQAVETQESRPATDAGDPTANVGAPGDSPAEQPRGDREETAATAQKSAGTPAAKFSLRSYESLKAEMEENINRNFAGFENLLSTFLLDGKFSENDYNEINATYRTALKKTFDTDPYKAKYSDLSPSLIDETMAQSLKETEDRSWGPALRQYMRQYQEVASGVSR